MPAPTDDATPWISLLTAYPHEWRLIVGSFAAYDSSVQKKAPTPPVPCGQNDAAEFVCPTCQVSFKSNKALKQHTRIKHGVRCEWSAFVPGSSCPVCAKNFSHRLRVFAHLCDRRYGMRCADTIRAGTVPVIPEDTRLQLEADEANLRREAKLHGYTQPKVSGSHR